MNSKHFKSTDSVEIFQAQEEKIKTKEVAFDDEDDFISEEEDESIEESKQPSFDHEETVEKERIGLSPLWLCPISSCTFSHRKKNLILERNHLKESHPYVDNQMSFMVLG